MSLKDLGKASDALKLYNTYLSGLDDNAGGLNVFDALAGLKDLGSTNKLENMAKSLFKAGIAGEDLRNVLQSMDYDNDKITEAMRDLGDTGVSAFQKMKLTAKGLGESIKGAGAKIASFFTTTAGAATIAVAAVVALGAAYHYMATESDRAMDAYQEAASKYEETNSEVEDLEASLESAERKLKELNSVKTPSPTDKNEIDSLERSIELLNTQLEVKKKIRNFDAQEAAKAAAKTLGAKNIHYTGTTTVDGENVFNYEARSILDDAEMYKEDISDLVNEISTEWEKLNSFEEGSEGTDAFKEQQDKIKDLEQQKIDLEKSFSEVQNQILELYGSLINADGTAISGYEDLVGRIESVCDLYQDTLEETQTTAENTTDVSISRVEALRDSMQTLWDSESFADSRKELTKLAKTIDGIKAKDIETLAEQGGVLAEVLEEDGMNAEFLAYCLEEVAEGRDGFAAITEGALELNKALSGIADEFDKVTEARNRYSEAMSAEEKDAGFKSYAEALETLQGEIQKGTTNSNAFWASAEMLYGDELLKSWEYSVDKIKSGVPELSKVFGNADSAGQQFLDRLYAMSQAGELEGIAEIARNATGGFDFKIDSGDIGTLAKKMNMSEEAVLACVEALGMWCDIDLYNIDEIISSTEKIGILMDYAGQRVVNLEQLMAHLEARDLNARDIADVINDLADDGVMILDLTADVDSLITSFQSLGVITQSGIISNESYIQLAQFLAEIGYTRAEVETLTERLVGAGNVDLSAMIDTSLILDEIDFRDPEKGLHDVSNAIEDVDDSSISNVQSRFDRFLLTIKNIKSNLYGVVNAIGAVNSSGGVNQAHKNNQSPSMSVNATGTSNSPGGLALLGDEYSPTGEPKPELVVSGDKAYLAGVDGPVIGNLKPGDRVYTASETKKILHGRSFKTIPAFAFGGVVGGVASKENSVLDSGGYSAQDAFNDLKKDTAYWAEVKKCANKILTSKLVADAGATGSRALTLYYSDFIGKLSDISKLQRFNSHSGAWALLQNELLGSIPESVYRDAYLRSNGKSYMPAKYAINGFSETKESSSSSDSIEIGGSTTGGAGGAGYVLGGSSSATKEETEFERLYKEHQHKRAMDKETDEEYLSWLEGAYKEAYEKGEMELDDYRKYTEEVYELQKEIFQDHLSDLEHDIDQLTREGGKDKEIIALYERMISEIEAEIQKARDNGLNDNSGYIQDLESQIWEYQDEIKDIQEELAENAKDAVEDLVDYRIDMIKSELEAEKDALNDRLDEYKAFCDKQKNLLQDQYDHEKRLDEQNEKRKARSDIQEELNSLRFDDSAWAQKRRLELQSELANADKSLKDFERDNALKEAQELLDQAYEKQEVAINSQIDAVEAKLNDPDALYNRALNDIRNNTAELYYAMVDFNNANGSGNPDEIREMWDEAYMSLNNYMLLYGEAYKDIMLVASSSGIEAGGYASGTSHALPGFRRVNELGAEDIFVRANGDKYRMFSGGEKVLNAKATEFLYNFANSGGKILPDVFSDIVSKMRSVLFENISPATQVIEVKAGDIIVQGNATEKTVSEIRRAQREGIDYILKEFGRLNR